MRQLLKFLSCFDQIFIKMLFFFLILSQQIHSSPTLLKEILHFRFFFQMMDTESQSSRSALRLHSPNCDKMYRWAMWRMYLNEDMSLKISNREDFGDTSSTVMSVAQPYLQHPDSFDYGKMMRQKFGQSRGKRYNGPRLADNQYLVFGIPRISLHKDVPTDLVKLYRSCPDISYMSENVKENSIERMQEKQINATTESEQITHLFRFVSSEITDQSLQERNQDHTDSSNTNKEVSAKAENETSNIDNIISEDIDQERQVTRSRIFWKQLADRKQDIIQLGQETGGSAKVLPKQTRQEHVISSDILKKQQTLLRATPKPKSNKEMWKSLAERKTEILKLSKSNENVKRKEGKSSHLWNFIFSKKNEILHIKRGQKSNNDISATRRDSKSGSALNNDLPKHKTDSLPKAIDFEDSFQKELAERLRKRRLKETAIQE